MESMPHKGDKVRLSRYAPNDLIDGEFTVIGKSRDGQCAWIIRDGTKTKDSYHIRFLKLVEKSGVKRVKP
jgi:hypothetical protein